MAMKTKKELKNVFSGLSSLLYQSADLDLSSLNALAIAPEYDLPVKVDSITLEQGDPSLEHYKVIGLPGDWVTSSEPGDIDLSFRVPTKNTDVLKMAYGNAAVQAAGATVSNTGGVVDGTFVGSALTLVEKKIEGTFVFVDDTKKKLLVITNASLWAKPVLDQDAKGVFAIDFNGTIVSDGTNPDILFLEKQEASSSSEG